MIEYFTDVAKECINIGNFNSLMAIIGKLEEWETEIIVKSLIWVSLVSNKFVDG